MKRGYWYIAASALLFSSMEVALKFVSGQFHPIQINFTRFLVGGIILLPLALRALRQRGVSVDRRAMASFAVLGLMGITLSMTFYQLAVTRLQASVVGVLFSSNPVFVTLFAFLLLHEAIAPHQILGLVLDVAGIAAIIKPWNLELDTLGVIFVLIATLMFSLYGVSGKGQCAKYGGVVVTCGSFLFGAAEMIVLALLTHVPVLAGFLTGIGLGSFADIPFFSGYTLASLPVVLFIFVAITGGGYSCYFLAMEATSAQQTSLVFFFKSALVPIFAFLILHEEITGNMLVGIALILCGSLVSLVPNLLKARRVEQIEKR